MGSHLGLWYTCSDCIFHHFNVSLLQACRHMNAAQYMMLRHVLLGFCQGIHKKVSCSWCALTCNTCSLPPSLLSLCRCLSSSQPVYSYLMVALRYLLEDQFHSAVSHQEQSGQPSSYSEEPTSLLLLSGMLMVRPITSPTR